MNCKELGKNRTPTRRHGALAGFNDAIRGGRNPKGLCDLTLEQAGAGALGGERAGVVNGEKFSDRYAIGAGDGRQAGRDRCGLAALPGLKRGQSYADALGGIQLGQGERLPQLPKFRAREVRRSFRHGSHFSYITGFVGPFPYTVIVVYFVSGGTGVKSWA